MIRKKTYLYGSIIFGASLTLGMLLSGCPGFGDHHPGIADADKDKVDVIIFNKANGVKGDVKILTKSGDHLYAVAGDGIFYSSDSGASWSDIDVEADGPGNATVKLSEGDIKKVIEYKDGAIFMGNSRIVVMKGDEGDRGWMINTPAHGLTGAEEFLDVVAIEDKLLASRDKFIRAGGIARADLSGAVGDFKEAPVAGINFSASRLGKDKGDDLIVYTGIFVGVTKSVVLGSAPLIPIIPNVLKPYPGEGDPVTATAGDWDAANNVVSAISHVGDYILVGLEASTYATPVRKGGLMVFKKGEKATHLFSSHSVKGFTRSKDGQGVYAHVEKGSSISGVNMRFINEKGKREKDRDITDDSIGEKKDWINGASSSDLHSGKLHIFNLHGYYELDNNTHIIHSGLELIIGQPGKGLLHN